MEHSVNKQWIHWSVASHLGLYCLSTSHRKDARFVFFEDQKPQNGYLANSEDPDEMPHHVAFHQGLHCVLRQNQSSEEDI